MTAQMNAHPGLPTESKDSTLDQPTIITITINATFLKQNPSASLTQLNFFPHHTLLPATSSTDKIALDLQDLLELLQHPSLPISFPNYGTDLYQCICRLDKHLSSTKPKSTTANNKTSLLPIAISRVLHSNCQRRQRVPSPTVQRVVKQPQT